MGAVRSSTASKLQALGCRSGTPEGGNECQQTGRIGQRVASAKAACPDGVRARGAIPPDRGPPLRAQACCGPNSTPQLRSHQTVGTMHVVSIYALPARQSPSPQKNGTRGSLRAGRRSHHRAFGQ